ncbi:hypothetical protein L1987_44342 [Smallanthus sonchifolius]|uniref:Uncharacterized protein n=1 Tax=Smallanthus sonchifolius TaxID=185202 RepID=A0ACB9GP68_9ASTR|nr:hypothetical protein L1987_44342 [Smallanthus sonchifolius]
MLVSVPSLARATVLPLHKEHKARARLHVRAQSLRDEGRLRNLVDSNMKLLKDRIEVMRAKERLERNHRPDGWDYESKYIQKRPRKQPEYLQTIALICGASSLSILIGTILLCIFSIIVHLKI